MFGCHQKKNHKSFNYITSYDYLCFKRIQACIHFSFLQKKKKKNRSAKQERKRVDSRAGQWARIDVNNPPIIDLMGKGFSTLFSTFWLKLPNDCDSGLWSVRDCGWIYSKINDELLLLFLKAFSQVLLLLFYIAPTERNFTSKHSNLRSDK